MTISLTHTKVSGIPDNPVDAAEGDVLPSDWNAQHVLTQASGKLLGRSTAGTGATEEITPDATLSLAGGSLSVVAGDLTKTDDANVTLTLGGTPAGSLLKATSLTVGWTGTLAAGRLNSNVVQAVTNDTNVTGSIASQNLALGWTGQLGLTRGGTNASLTASNGGIVYSAASALAVLSGTATAKQMLQSGASAAPAWSTATWPATTTTQQLLYSSAANTVSGLTVGNGCVVYATTTGTMQMTAGPALGLNGAYNGQIGFYGATSGLVQVVPQTAAGNPTLTLPNTSGTIAASAAAPITLNATTGQIGVTGSALTTANDTNITLTLGGTSSTALLAAASITAGWTGTLSVARGGTGTGTFSTNAILKGNGTSAIAASGVTIDSSNNIVGAPSLQNTAGVAIQGTNTNDNAAAGYKGEYRLAGSGKQVNATVTVSIASPSVVTWTSHPYQSDGTAKGAAAIVFGTTGALPTGITAGTTYYVALPVLSANTFNIATSVDNAIAGIYINTSGSQSGTQSATSQSGNLVTSTTYDMAGLQLTAGDWDVGLYAGFSGDAATATTATVASLNTAAATLNQTPGYFGKFPAFSAPFASSGQLVINNNGMARFSLSSTTTIYANVFANFSGGNLQTPYVSIEARRRR